MTIKIQEPGTIHRMELNEKRREEERLRKALGCQYTRDDGIVGIWEAIYKEGSVPKT